MNLEEYSKFVETMWFVGQDPSDESSIAIASLGLGGETGEVLEILKKRLRDGTYDRNQLIKELGDVLYYWCKLGNFFNITPQEIIETNVEKITGRRERGTLAGSGNDR